MSVASPDLILPCAIQARRQAGDLAITRDLDGIAGAAVNPGVADLLGDDGEVGAVGLDGVGDFSQIGGNDLGVGELLVQIVVDVFDFVGGVRAAVVAAHVDGDGKIGAGDAVTPP